MKRFALFSVFVASLFCFVNGSSADKVGMIEGKGRPLDGAILLITAEKVTILDNKEKQQEIPANTVAWTSYEGEPPELATARTAVNGGRMQEAIDALAKIEPKQLTGDGMKGDGMKQDYAYFLAYAKAKLVLAGGGNAEDAEKELSNFLKNFKTSYHYYEICEIYGDMMVQLGRFDDAKKSYDALKKAPWPEYNLKATVSLGMAEISEGKADAAKRNFEAVIASTDESPQAERQKSMAKIGLALCLVADKKYEEAVETLERIARESGSEDALFQAMVYNSLGSAYDQADKPHEAALAYMHTDILFSSARSEHIKSLKELHRLWKKIQRTTRAEEVAKRLKDLYNETVK